VKGLVFTEFLGMVEQQYGMSVVDELLTMCELPSGGQYTAVGTYDHRELIDLIGRLASRLDRPADELIRELGAGLFPPLLAAAPKDLVNVNDAFSFLEVVDRVIHIEVRKLYPDAELPTFEVCRLGDDGLEMIYRSARPFATLAEGLIQGCIEHFGESVTLTREPIDGEAQNASRFLLKRNTS
jgi:hypothetical protein